MAGRRLEALTLTEAEQSELTVLAGRPKTAQALAQRARIILACAEGLENKAVSRQLDVHAMTVGKWRRRFLDQRVEGDVAGAHVPGSRQVGPEAVDRGAQVGLGRGAAHLLVECMGRVLRQTDDPEGHDEAREERHRQLDEREALLSTRGPDHCAFSLMLVVT